MRTKLLKSLKLALDSAVQYAPQLFTLGAILGLGATIYVTAVATDQARDALEDENRRRAKLAKKCTHGVLSPDPLTPYEELKICIPYYAPVGLFGGLTAACIVGGHVTHVRRYEAISAAYTLSMEAFREYREKTAHYYGPRKAKRILEEVYEDEIQKYPWEEKLVIQTGKGETLCYERISKQYFRSDIDYIRHCVNVCEQELFSNEFLTLNDFYLQIGLPLQRLGDETGWDAARGGLDVEYSSMLSSRGEPVLILDCRVIPRYYRDFA